MAKHTRARRVIPDDEDVELKTEEPQDVPDDMPSDKLVHLSDEDRDADSGHEDADDLASGDEEQPADDFAGLPPLPPDDDDDFDEDGALAEQKEARENRKRQREEAPEKKRRGRKKMVPATADMPYLDDEGNPLKVERDEIVMEDEDPKALEKVDENGRLKGGREYRNRVFTVLNLGDQLFMLSTEPARLVGFRDSYLLFKTHANTLYKKICTNEEKQDLIERGLLPNSYKGRAVNLVTARLIYREFGARMLKNGKKVVDEFWEQRAIDNGDVSGELADPNELYRKNQFVGGFAEIPSADAAPDLPSYASSTPLPTDETWLHQIAVQTSSYNKKLLDDRTPTHQHGLKDLYLNLVFWPALTQPTRAVVKRVGPLADGHLLEFDAHFYNKDITRKVTGLKLVPKDVFDELDDPTPVLAQQKFEMLQQ